MNTSKIIDSIIKAANPVGKRIGDWAITQFKEDDFAKLVNQKNYEEFRINYGDKEWWISLKKPNDQNVTVKDRELNKLLKKVIDYIDKDGYVVKKAARDNPDDWKRNFIVLGDKVTLVVQVIAAEANGWRTEVGFSKDGMVIEDPKQSLKSDWSKSFEEAEKKAKSFARNYGISWKPKPYGKQSNKISAKTVEPFVSGRVKAIGYDSRSKDYFFVSKNGLTNSFSDKYKFLDILKSAIDLEDVSKVEKLVEKIEK